MLPRMSITRKWHSDQEGKERGIRLGSLWFDQRHSKLDRILKVVNAIYVSKLGTMLITRFIWSLSFILWTLFVKCYTYALCNWLWYMYFCDIDYIFSFKLAQIKWYEGQAWIASNKPYFCQINLFNNGRHLITHENE